ncbi:hypothetical protein P175DRAFT_0343449 [Aspergillus ochraceoroseus IBT 24754]|uniref:Purple acid phosphatase n=3 Tax=Aspergillus subgen. Nidulantes TaxID=2720870 RepID=A0A0F8UYX3_9EURO|nr:uncharacterized protein P175DRAFT_0343449 [Aspergillus ochraceoroseus IBT 24754]KKK16471.1 hypothetical protein AOCH_004868 [Aspergillus ochraceoroseus]KKK24689.1 hypothetical protein ARAM_003779 [Aspergillus rambellii]PTU19036.1 hypothetical protein P175DRAFT_0343449 [Aspergillus ochraceoroseus IBT 24754]
MASSLLLAFSLTAIGYAAGSPQHPWKDPFFGCQGHLTKPEQLHFNYAGDRGMIVSWNTPEKLSFPTVRYGRGPELDHIAFSEVSVTYPTSTTYSNHVLIKHLEPDTHYEFAVHCADEKERHQFKTSLPAGNSRPFAFAFFGDLGTMGPLGLTTYGQKAALKPGEINTMQSLREFKDQFEFVWQDGDLAYADDWLTEEINGFLPNMTIEDGTTLYEDILNTFYDEMAGNVTMDRPYMVGPGNHEANCDNGGKKDKATGVKYTESICVEGQTNFTGFRNHFRMPSEQSGGLENFWYSWDYGMVHFIQFNTETDFPDAPDLPGGSAAENAGPFAPNGTQLKWLKDDLAAVDRKKTPWVIVAGHRPWYVDGSKCDSCQAAFEPLLLEYGVDIALFGHKHFYERFTPIANGEPDPNGLDNPSAPWYLVSGAAGHYAGLGTLDLPLANYTDKAIDTVYGWSRFTVHNCTHITQDFIASANGTVLDSATLYKNHNGCGGHEHHHHH